MEILLLIGIWTLIGSGVFYAGYKTREIVFLLKVMKDN